ncbi:hypothetical protein [Nesterenkonia suensis]
MVIQPFEPRELELAMSRAWIAANLYLYARDLSDDGRQQLVKWWNLGTDHGMDAEELCQIIIDSRKEERA